MARSSNKRAGARYGADAARLGRRGDRAFRATNAGQGAGLGEGAVAFYHAQPGRLDQCWCEVNEGRDFFEWREPVP